VGTGTIDKRAARKEGLEIASAAMLSILFITGIWFSVSRGQDTLVSLDIPIDYINRAAGTEIVDTSVKSVSLVLSGSGALVKSITPDQVGVRLDLSKTTVGRNTFTITSDSVSLPPGIVLREVTPSEIDVLIDETIKKKLPVQIDWVGKLSDNLILVDSAVNPDQVEVSGSKRILEDIVTIYTEKVLLDELSGEGEMTANLVLSPASLKIASGSKDKVTIQYLIRERE
jgi:hypothetical protein